MMNHALALDGLAAGERPGVPSHLHQIIAGRALGLAETHFGLRLPRRLRVRWFEGPLVACNTRRALGRTVSTPEGIVVDLRTDLDAAQLFLATVHEAQHAADFYQDPAMPFSITEARARDLVERAAPHVETWIGRLLPLLS
jgi:hypothetical protein